MRNGYQKVQLTVWMLEFVWSTVDGIVHERMQVMYTMGKDGRAASEVENKLVC